MGKMWRVKGKVLPVVMGVLTVLRRLESFLGFMGISAPVELIQKTMLLGTARILRKVLERWGLLKGRKTKKKTKQKVVKLWVTLGNWLMLGTHRGNLALKNSDQCGNEDNNISYWTV